MADLPGRVIPADVLRDFVAAIFAAAGCDAAEAGRIGHYLVSANLTGHDSHGVIRTPNYIRALQAGGVVAGAAPTVVSESATHATVDGNYGFGQTIGPLAVDMGIAKARAAGMAAIALRHSGHIGRIGDWAERAAAAGLVSIHFVNVAEGELVAPFGGVDRRFSTNPVCIGIPAEDGAPILLLDFATSIVAEGKVLVASRGGKKVPDNAMVQPDGVFTGDPAAMYGPLTPENPRNPADGPGALVAFGDHKGSGLAFMCEILAGVLTGGETSGPIPGGKRTRISNGMLSIYLDPAHFGTAGFAARARDYAAYFKASRPVAAGGEVLAPGEPEARMRAERLSEGVPLALDAWESIVATAASLGVAAPVLSGTRSAQRTW